ncbi:MAG: sialidase family protein [Actinomycetota bacterium]
MRSVSYIRGDAGRLWLVLLALVALTALATASAVPEVTSPLRRPVTGSWEAHEHHPDLGDLERPVVDIRTRTQNGRGSSGDRAVAHHAGADVIRAPRWTKRAPEARLFHTGVVATEPTLGITKNGDLFFTGGRTNEPVCICPTPIVMTSRNEGLSWKDVSPTGPDAHITSQDPYTYVDKRTDRLFTVDYIGCSHISFSDDGGKSWDTGPPAGCGWNTDHQNLFAGPPPEGSEEPTGYPNVVYLCSIGGGALAQTGSSSTCSRSLDGGLTFVPSGEPAFPPTPEWITTMGNCDGATAHGYVDSRGVVYLPRGWCGQPHLAISEDAGATWRRVQVAGNGMPEMASGYPDHEAGVVVDENGVIYYAWVAKDRLPYLSISRDRGETWSKPMMVGPPGLNEAMLPALEIGDPGKLAMTYMGSTDSPGAPWDAAAYGETTWTAYVTMTPNALAREPVFFSAGVTDPDDDPLIEGPCGPLRCQAEFDFIDVQVGPDGDPWAVMVDGCPRKGECGVIGEGVVARLAGGPSLGRGVYPAGRGSPRS